MSQKSPEIGQCPICLSNLYKSNIYAISKCGHTFHQKCIYQWISSAKQCPTCQTNAFQSDIIKLLIQENNVEIVIPKKEEILPYIEKEATTRREQRRQRVAERLGIVVPKKEEILPYIEKKYDGCIRRIMKECKCEIIRYETFSNYKCLKDFDINICSIKETGNIRIIFPNEIIVKTYQSKILAIILEKTNETCIVHPNGKISEPYYAKMRNGRKEFLITRNKGTFRFNEDTVEQDENRIKFCFPKFTVKRYLKNGENGEVTIRVYTNDPKKSLKIKICSEHQSYFVEHLFEKKISRCTNSEFLCDHLHE
uniref:RING-type domain-containing protein n=1 Tax=Panagrolaimus davidi TaxID=227884 RepID=A0A914P4D5_9BILA